MKPGFTITELLVAISLLVLLSVICATSVYGIKSSSAEKTAINLVESQLTSARLTALRGNHYTAFIISYDPSNPLQHLKKCGVAIWKEEEGNGALLFKKRWRSLPSQYAFDNSEGAGEQIQREKTSLTAPINVHLGNLVKDKVSAEIFQISTVTTKQEKKREVYALFFSPQGEPVTLSVNDLERQFTPIKEVTWFYLSKVKADAEGFLRLNQIRVPFGVSPETGSVL